MARPKNSQLRAKFRRKAGAEAGFNGFASVQPQTTASSSISAADPVDADENQGPDPQAAYSTFQAADSTNADSPAFIAIPEAPGSSSASQDHPLTQPQQADGGFDTDVASVPSRGPVCPPLSQSSRPPLRPLVLAPQQKRPSATPLDYFVRDSFPVKSRRIMSSNQNGNRLSLSVCDLEVWLPSFCARAITYAHYSETWPR